MRISDWSSDVCSADLSAWSRFVVPALEKRGSGDDMLNDAKIRAARPGDKEYKLTDSHRLYLLVTPNGSKHWKWSYDHEQKQKTMAFGSYPRSEERRVGKERVGTWRYGWARYR